MAKSLTITNLEVSDFKRIKAVKMNFTGNAMTVIGGDNGQGKTSIIDAIMYALGGERYRPTNAKRDGSMVDPFIRLTMSNGLVVERKGNKSSLKVTDRTGKVSGQSLLNEFIEELALNLPKFLGASDKEKVNQLLKIIGVGDQLKSLDDEEKTVYDKRHDIGVIKDQKEKYAAEMPNYPEAPEHLLSMSELIKQQQSILVKNGENMKKRNQVAEYERMLADSQRKFSLLEIQMKELNQAIERERDQEKHLRSELLQATKTVESIRDESTEELEASISNIETVNIKVRSNLDKQKAIDDCEYYKTGYSALSVTLEEVRQKKVNLLKGADLPLPGLSISDGELVYNDQRWDCMSSAEQLIVGTSIVRKLNPNCWFVLLDKMEQMDTSTLNKFSEWLDENELQVIGTRVSRGPECSIIIEDGTGELDGPDIATPPQPEPVLSGSMEGAF
jgi:chromosome segregation ATPase